MKCDDENPDYITAVFLGQGHYSINRMTWDARADDYIVGECHDVRTGSENMAKHVSERWAEKLGLEVR